MIFHTSAECSHFGLALPVVIMSSTVWSSGSVQEKNMRVIAIPQTSPETLSRVFSKLWLRVEFVSWFWMVVKLHSIHSVSMPLSPEGCRRVVVDPVRMPQLHCGCHCGCRCGCHYSTKQITGPGVHQTSSQTSSQNIPNIFTSFHFISLKKRIFTQHLQLPHLPHPRSQASGHMGGRLDARRGISGTPNPGESPLQLGHLRANQISVRCHEMSVLVMSEFPIFQVFQISDFPGFQFGIIRCIMLKSITVIPVHAGKKKLTLSLWFCWLLLQGSAFGPVFCNVLLQFKARMLLRGFCAWFHLALVAVSSAA